MGEATTMQRIGLQMKRRIGFVVHGVNLYIG
jgi:hypothetical protein